MHSPVHPENGAESLGVLQHQRQLSDCSDQDLRTRSICPLAPRVLLVLKPPRVIAHVPEAMTSIASHHRQPEADFCASTWTA